MFSIKNTNKKALINEIVKSASILLAVHVLTNLRLGKKLFDEDSLYVIVFTLIGIAFYYVIVANIIVPQ